MKKLFIPLIILFTVSCSEHKTALTLDVNDLQHTCVKRLTDIVVYDIFNPPVASRIYAYCNLAYYETVRWKDSSSASIASQLKGFETMPSPDRSKKYDHSLAAVKAFFKVANKLTFSHDSLRITEEKLLGAFKASLDDEVYENSIAFGDTVAATILKRAASDNYKITRGMARYSVFREKGKWVQTPPDYADGVEPNWKLIKPLLMDSASQFKPAVPPAYDLNKSSEYFKQVMEVYTTSKSITEEMDTIAHYWDDNPFVTEHRGHLTFATKKTTPVGHWMGIIAILCRQEKKNEQENARTYALASASIFDAFISCWDEKYRSQTLRPITVIREQVEENWNPLLQTPPFPEYTSGHSVISSAVATVLEYLFGKDVSFHDTTELEYLGLERNFSSIQAAADEAGISRLYGGIHFKAAIEEGKKQGHAVGEMYGQHFKTN